MSYCVPDLPQGQFDELEAFRAETDGKPVLEVAKLPDLARCSVAARDYGDMRVKLFVQDHPGLKAAFKALARALRTACEVDPRRSGAASTKGTLG